MHRLFGYERLALGVCDTILLRDYNAATTTTSKHSGAHRRHAWCTRLLSHIVVALVHCSARRRLQTMRSGWVASFATGIWTPSNV